MRFEARELPAHAQPVSPGELKEGSVYFSVNFVDEAMLIPVLEPVVFVGRDLNTGDVGRVYFQDFESYRSGVRYPSKTAEADEPAIYSGPDNSIDHIFEFDRAVEVLMRCSVRRQKAKG
jgi:hypothetical protein